MYAIVKKEVQSFFASPLGYVIVGSFLVFTGLVLWVFKGNFNLFDYGFADLTPFFVLTSWIFTILVPAITMKSFSEEQKLGTLELLLSKPIPLWQLVLGKFWGAFLVCGIAVIPTLVYVIAIANLGITEGNYDLGIILGSYFGLVFLIAAYTSIGLFASTLSEQQITVFITGILLCFLIFMGFDAMSTLLPHGKIQPFVQTLGAKAHFDSIARGVIDTRDLVYFVSVALFFLYLTWQRLKNIPA